MGERRASAGTERPRRVAAWVLACAVAFASTSAASPERASPPEASLRVLVTDVAGKPIAGAEVRAWSVFTLVRELAGWNDRIDLSLPPDDGRATTSADGRARVAGEPVRRGRYVVRVAAEGFGVAVAGSVVAWEGGGPEPVVVLGEGTTVEGDVLDGAGRPVAGAVVAAGQAAGWEDVKRNPRVTSIALARVVGRTDARGAFRLTGVPATSNPETPGSALEGHDVHVQPSADVRVSRAIPAAPRGRIRVRAGGACAVDGTVAGLDGAAVAGATVTVHVASDRDDAATGGAAGDEAASYVVRTRTDAKGTFVVSGVPRGGVFLANARGGGRVGSFGTLLDPVRVSPTAPAHLSVRLQPTVTVTGTVTGPAGDAAPAGILVLNLLAEPLEAAAVETDDRGDFRLAGIDRSRAGGDPQDPEPRPLVLAVGLPWLVVPFDRMEVAVPRGATKVDHTLRLAAASSISGTVRDPQGAPVRDAEVWCEPEPGTRGRLDGLPGAVLAGRDGTFVLPALDGRRWTVFAWAPSRGAPSETVVTLTAGEEKRGVEVRLGPREAPSAK